MKRRDLMIGLAALLAAAPAAAQDIAVDRILRELRGLGYGQISVERTLLGRARIVAESTDASREIIVNPNTGEILRDLWTPRSGGGSSGGLLDVSSDDRSSRGNSGSGPDRDDGDDGGDDSSDDRSDDRDNDRDNDNSGSGSGPDGDDDGGQGRGRGRGGDDD